MKATISQSRLLAAAAITMAKQDVRYYLNGILLEHPPKGTDGLIIVSTDGHRLFAAIDESAYLTPSWPERFILKLSDDALKAIKLVKNLGEPVTVEVTKDNVTVSVNGSKFANCEEIDGVFPEWRRIAKDVGDDITPGWFNQNYLADFAKIATILDENRSRFGNAITLRGNDAESACNVYFDNSPHAFGILMPIRSHTGEPSLPAFMGPVKKPVTPIKRDAESAAA